MALLKLPDAEKRECGLLYTPSEIAQQPVTWQATHRHFESCRAELKSFLKQAHDERWPVCLIGAGTSDYIGHSVANLLRRGWGCEVSVVASTDMLTNREDQILPERNYLWIHFSRSGESPEGAAVLEQGLAFCPKVKHLVVSCNEHGRMVKLARESDDGLAILLDDAVNDRGLAMTSSFTNMVIFGQALSSLWRDDGFERKLESMTLAAEFLLNQGATLAHDLSRTLKHEGSDKACFVGAGSLGAVARESALKLLELTSGRIQTMYETTLGLRHGPMSSLNSGTLFTAFLSSGENRRRYDGDLLHEVRAKRVVRTIVGIGGASAACDFSLNCPAFTDIPDAYRPAVDVIFGQMLGLFSSIELGMKPDSPSPNGLISRVVEKFAIYA
ncbi:MAG: SIS domain-containing protein [Acidobacteriota bacterium]|nr:SIS domain-containing protein [Acidobacteriota bacterium]